MTSSNRRRIVRTLAGAHSDIEDAAVCLSEGQTKDAAESVRKAYQNLRRLTRQLGPVLREKGKPKA